jgi:hypothetical protein
MITASEAAKISTTVQKNFSEKEFLKWTEIVTKEIRKAAESGDFSKEIWLEYPARNQFDIITHNQLDIITDAKEKRMLFERMENLLITSGYVLRNAKPHYAGDEFNGHAWFKVDWTSAKYLLGPEPMSKL